MPNILAGRKVLIVEDEAMILLELHRILLETGCSLVATATTVDRALSAIASTNFDAAALDVRIAGSDSFPIADQLIEQSVPFIFMTAYDDAYLKGKYSARPVLTKPFKVTDLIAKLGNVLRDEPS